MSAEAQTIAITIEIDDPALANRLASLLEGVAGLCLVAQGQSAHVAIVSRQAATAASADSACDLTPRERDVLALMAEGRTNQAIAGIVHLSPRAVERTVTSIFGKLRLPDSPDSHRRVLAVIAYLQG